MCQGRQLLPDLRDALRIQLAACLLSEKRLVEAMTQVDEVLELEPDHALARRVKAQLQIEIDRLRGGG